MTTPRYTTDGVRFFLHSSPIEGVPKEGKDLPPKGVNKKEKSFTGRYAPTATSYPQFVEFKFLFSSINHADLQKLPEQKRIELFKRAEEIFFAWMCAARRQGLTTSKETKRLKFFEFAKNELDAQLHGFGLLTQEFLPSKLPPFADENQLAVPDADCSWMVENPSPAVTSSSSMVAYWQPSTSRVPIPTLQETLNLIAEQQAFIDGFVPSQPISDSDF